MFPKKKKNGLQSIEKEEVEEEEEKEKKRKENILNHLRSAGAFDPGTNDALGRRKSHF